jgi:GT2 family glycosyltransferase
VTGADVTVVIVNYNAGALLDACLGSVRRFAGDLALELVVVDNASSDGSAQALAGRPDVRLIRNPGNRGFAGAVNQGLAASRGRHVLLLNPDAELVAPVCQALLAFLDAHPAAGIVGPRLLNPDRSLQPSAYRFPTLFQAAGTLFRLRRLVPTRLLRATAGRWLGQAFGQLDPHRTARRVDYVTGACCLVRRAVVERIGELDERFFMYFEEQDFCLRARQAGWETWFDPAAEVVHHIGGSSRGDPAITVVERMRSMRRFYDKHYRPGYRLALRGLLLVGGAVRWALAGLAGDRRARHAWARVIVLALEPAA